VITRIFQGGVDVGEETIVASKREMYEEVGLEFGKHVMMGTNSDDNTATISCKYKTEGTGSWLEKQGFAGQQLTLYLYSSTSTIVIQNVAVFVVLRHYAT